MNINTSIHAGDMYCYFDVCGYNARDFHRYVNTDCFNAPA
jgi:hypothetical protein